MAHKVNHFRSGPHTVVEEDWAAVNRQVIPLALQTSSDDHRGPHPVEQVDWQPKSFADSSPRGYRGMILFCVGGTRKVTLENRHKVFKFGESRVESNLRTGGLQNYEFVAVWPAGTPPIHDAYLELHRTLFVVNRFRDDPTGQPEVLLEMDGTEAVRLADHAVDVDGYSSAVVCPPIGASQPEYLIPVQ